MKKWIWQQDNYPNFIYDLKKLEELIQKVSFEQGYLIALTQTMHNDAITQRKLEALMSEAISTSAIEGEILNRDSVKASVQRKLGFKDSIKVDISTDYLVEILIDANTNYNQDLTLSRLFGWHNALFPTGYSGLHKIRVASFRGDDAMEIVSGTAGDEKVYFQAPPRDMLESEMARFLEWFNKTPASLIKACIAHLWFVIIHPFDDGNGRTARAITDLVLSKLESSTVSRLYSMSSTINANKKSYYSALEHTTGYIAKNFNHLDITRWCEWFLSTLYESLIDTKQKLDFILQKTKFWDKNKHLSLNARQIKVLNFILDIGVSNFKGNLSKKKYMSISGAAPTTASRDLAELALLKCIRQVDGTNGRNICYKLI